MTPKTARMFEEVVEQRLRPLAAAFAQSGLVRMRLTESDLEIELRRSVVPGSARPEPAAAAEPDAVSAHEQPAPAYDILAADLVGIVRFSRPLVQEGDLLSGERELAYVEALGIRNPVSSRGSGRLAVIYVQDGQAVDYGHPLFAIERGA